MGVAGLIPFPDDKPSVRVSKERLAEFDRLWAEGKSEAQQAILAAYKWHKEHRRWPGWVGK